jgi:catechol 2,3-dioxygenase-like lactoylglutathione lyase family enzyme
MRINRLHHAQITIPPGQEAAARAFYCDLLGCREIEKPDSLLARGGFWLQIADIQVHIGIQDHIDRAALKAHLAFEVEDLLYWEKGLRDAGLRIEDSVPIPGYARFETRDPFGNRLEFIKSLA